MTSVNYTQVENSLSAEVDAFAVERYGSKSGLARAMGISPQHLHGYLTGQKVWGTVFIAKLIDAGFKSSTDDRFNRGLVDDKPDSCINKTDGLDLGAIPDLHGACRLLACTPEELAQRIGASRKLAPAWEAGEARPSYDQLVMLYHQVLAIAVHCCEAERRPAATAVAHDDRPAAVG